ncbi:MAG: hypothetical protein A2161_14185 [Candidatus Schekmanbacteria bacterium RBG_13_48_7]|uniref:Uncharacterized protein n=1 Tax=Candidatus Schekmanbacteria bacterium RBG_13_48_7 TaxID=1817878 RepID=A0A1F7S1J2_9BACT|nr:MAG: hypothetical protein A2161_14185 [Candidatus Schekmanbacteria bacterium RBG_13_48_7]
MLDDGEYLSSVDLTTANGFIPGEFYWFDGTLDDGTNSFELTWAFEVCGMDELTVNGMDIHPSTVYRGEENVPMYLFDLSCDNLQNGRVTVTGIRIHFTGDARTDIATEGVNLYRDIDENGIFNADIDILAARGSLGMGTVVTLTLEDLFVDSTHHEILFLVTDITTTANIGNRVSFVLFSKNDVKVLQPDRCAHFISHDTGATIIENGGTPTPEPTFTLTMTPTETVATTTTATPSPTVSVTPADTMEPDNEGPLAIECNALITSGYIIEGQNFQPIESLVSDTDRGGNNVIGAEYFVNTILDNGDGNPMIPVDHAFDSPVERVAGVLVTGDWVAEESPYTVYIHGKDDLQNWGPFCSCIINVIEPGDPTLTPTTTPYYVIPGNGTAGRLLIHVLLFLCMCIGIRSTLYSYLLR